VEDVLTVGDQHEGVGFWGLVEGLQADATVMVLGGLRVEHVGVQHIHVRLHDRLPLCLVKVFIVFGVRPVPILMNQEAEDGETHQ
jgi:hypothetical protein